MKHASSEALREISELLDQIRAKDAISEKKPGIFYRKSNAFPHFHEDPAGLFARYPVNTQRERIALLSAIDRGLKS